MRRLADDEVRRQEDVGVRSVAVAPADLTHDKVEGPRRSLAERLRDAGQPDRCCDGGVVEADNRQR